MTRSYATWSTSYTGCSAGFALVILQDLRYDTENLQGNNLQKFRRQSAHVVPRSGNQRRFANIVDHARNAFGQAIEHPGRPRFEYLVDVFPRDAKAMCQVALHFRLAARVERHASSLSPAS